MATEDNVFFTFDPVDLSFNGIDSLKEEISNVGAYELFKDLFGDLEKVALKINADNKLINFNDYNYAYFIALIDLQYVNKGRSYEDLYDDFDVELDLIGVVDENSILKAGIPLTEFLNKEINLNE